MKFKSLKVLLLVFTLHCSFINQSHAYPYEAPGIFPSMCSFIATSLIGLPTGILGGAMLPNKLGVTPGTGFLMGGSLPTLLLILFRTDWGYFVGNDEYAGKERPFFEEC